MISKYCAVRKREGGMVFRTLQKGDYFIWDRYPKAGVHQKTGPLSYSVLNEGAHRTETCQAELLVQRVDVTLEYTVTEPRG